MGGRSMAIPKPGELSLGKAAEGVQIGSGHPISIQSVRRHQSPASLADGSLQSATRSSPQ